MSRSAPEPHSARAPLAGRIAWALFDWANQPYFTLIVTFVFAPYFARTVVGDATRGQEIWGYTQAAAGLVIALASPVLGAVADAAGRRKPWIAGFQAVLIGCCAALWLAVPEAEPARLAVLLVLLGLAAVAAEAAIVFNNAMLPTLEVEGRIGRLSGLGWALGYAGGLAALVLVLVAFSLPETPRLGLDPARHQHDRIVGPFAAVWIAVFVLPLFLWTPDAPARGLRPGAAAREGLRRLAATLRNLRRYRNLLRFLVARMIYIDGLSAIFAFGGIYAAGLFDWGTREVGLFGMVLTAFAAVGAVLGGQLDDRIGSRRTVLLSVAGLFVATLGVVSIDVEPLGEERRRETLLFFFSRVADAPEPGALLATPAEWLLLVFGVALGVFGGPAQAASRTLVSRLAPSSMVTEFYGLYALSGKATAFLAPFVVARLTGLFDSQRAGVAGILAFLALGGLLLRGVREEREAPVA